MASLDGRVCVDEEYRQKIFDIGISLLTGSTERRSVLRLADGTFRPGNGATRGQILASQAIEYALLGVALAALSLLLGLGGAWYVIVRIFEFSWLPDYGAVAITLGTGTAAIVAIGLAGAWPILGVRPARVLRQL